MYQHFCLAAGISILSQAALAATVTVSGYLSHTSTNHPDFDPFYVEFNGVYEALDSGLELVSPNVIDLALGNNGGLPANFSNSFTIGSTVFDEDNIRLSIFSNGVVGIRVNINGIADGNTNVIFDQDDFRAIGQTGAGNGTLLDLVDNPITFDIFNLTYGVDGSTGFSGVNVDGEITIGITDYTPTIAAVPLPAGTTFALTSLAAFALFRRKRAS